MKLLNFESSGELSKIGHHFRKYVFGYQKMSITKNGLLNSCSSMKKVQKDLDNF